MGSFEIFCALFGLATGGLQVVDFVRKRNDAKKPTVAHIQPMTPPTRLAAVRPSVPPPPPPPKPSVPVVIHPVAAQNDIMEDVRRAMLAAPAQSSMPSYGVSNTVTTTAAIGAGGAGGAGGNGGVTRVVIQPYSGHYTTRYGMACHDPVTPNTKKEMTERDAEAARIRAFASHFPTGNGS